MTVTSEQAVLQYDRLHASQPLAARYPWSRAPGLGSPELDYPYLVTASQPTSSPRSANSGACSARVTPPG